MNRQDYRRAISGVRWTAGKRRQIEALLQTPAAPPVLRSDPAASGEIESLLKQPTVKPINYQDRVKDTREPSKREVQEMNETRETADQQAKRNKRLLWLLIPAAVLGIGGTGMAVAFGRAGKTEQSDIDIESQIEDLNEDTLHLNLTNEPFLNEHFGYADSRVHGMYSIAKTENGYYFMNTLYGKEPDPEYATTVDGFEFPWYDGRSILFYSDAETGQTVPFCPNANCLHDGNLSCPASTPAYYQQQLVPYDDALYTVAYCSNPGEELTKAVVLRYEADASSITEVATLSTDVVGSSVPVIIHRGYLFTALQFEMKSEVPIGDDLARCGGYEIIGCELKTGKVVSLFKTMPKNPRTSTTVYEVPHALFADGDYLYFANDPRMINGRLSHELEQGTIRVSLKTGKTERILDRGALLVGHGYIIYQKSSNTSANRTDTFARNIATGEDILLEEAAKESGSVYLTDGKYFYHTYLQDGKTWFRAVDQQGNVVTEHETNVGLTGYNYFIWDGKYYLEREGETENGVWTITIGSPHSLWACDLEEAVKGNARFELVIDYNENSPYNESYEQYKQYKAEQAAKKEQERKAGAEGNAQ